MKEKNVKVGKVIHLVNSVMKTINTVVVNEVVRHDDLHGWLSANCTHLKGGEEFLYRHFFFGDYGIDNDRSSNKAFFTPAAARNYLRRCNHGM